MRRLHLFNPDNDLALAANLANYTPPPAASRLRRSGECLPLWYGADGDTFVSTGTDARWLDAVRGAFGMDVDVWPDDTAAFAPEPWGWSKATRTDFRHLGFEADALPSDAALDAMRALSHRRTAAALHALLPQQSLTPAAVEVDSFDALARQLEVWPHAVVKLPWSSSGRGVMGVSLSELTSRRPALEGAIRRQGSAMVEPRLAKGLDFAMLFDMDGGRATYRGLSLFDADIAGGYAGNRLMPQPEIEGAIKAATSAAAFDAIRAALAPALAQLIGTAYSGPLGIDFFTVEGSDRIALAEINLRRTMGRFCLDFADRYLAPGTRARFDIAPWQPGPAPARNGLLTAGSAMADAPLIVDGRLAAGTLALNPPASSFLFRVAVL